MQYLSPSEVRKTAPAISRLSPQDENLIDTSGFLHHVEELGYRPVEVIQGTPHADAESKTKGRHLAITANRAGDVLAILNSHTVWRRAWLGFGHYLSVNDDGLSTFLIGAVVPLQRWRGFTGPLDSVLNYKTSFLEAFHRLVDWRPEIHQMRWLAKQIARGAYLDGHKIPLARELWVPGERYTAQTCLHYMLGKVREGGLLPDASGNGTYRPRKLKPVQSPDAVFKAANVAFQVGIAGLSKYNSEHYAFPAFDSRSKA